MNIDKEIKNFLKDVDSLNERYNSVSHLGSCYPLVYCFWSLEEIAKSSLVQDEWNVPDCYVPFYGNWHDLFCYKNDGTIVELNDDRDIVRSWGSIKEFSSSLSWQEENASDTNGIIDKDSWLDF